MFVAFATAVHIATATPRFAFGRGIVDEIHASMSWKIEKEPMACRNMAWTQGLSVLRFRQPECPCILTKYRAPRLCVVVDSI